MRYSACLANSAFIAGHPLEAGGPAAAASVAIVLDLLGAEPVGGAGEKVERSESASGGAEAKECGGETQRE